MFKDIKIKRLNRINRNKKNTLHLAFELKDKNSGCILEYYMRGVK